MSENVNADVVLFAVRHGETEWNRAGKAQGHLDSPLTSVGMAQAHALADGLATSRIDVLYSSDLGRALRTAEIIAARLDLPIKKDKGLRERHLGVMQGLTMEEFNDRHPEEAARFNSGDPKYIIHGGESTEQRYDRIIGCAEDIVLRHVGQRVLIVAHGGVLNSFFSKALDLPLSEPRKFSLYNASINSFSIADGVWRLETWGNTSHLDGIAALDDV